MTRRLPILSALALLALAFSNVANAQPTTLGFEIPLCSAALGAQVPNGYGGFTWNENARCINGNDSDIQVGPTYPVNGYNKVGSGSNMLFNFRAENPVTFSSTTAFTLNSLDVSPAWYVGLNFTVDGFFLGSLVNTQSFVLTDSRTVRNVVLNWTNLDKVNFSSSGGSQDLTYYADCFANVDPVKRGCNGQQFAVDNLKVDIVPEPSTYALMAAGLAALGIAARRRRSQLIA